MGQSLNTSAWQKLRARVIKDARQVFGDTPPCGICGHPVDLSLSGRDPWGPSVDHVVPRAFGAPVLADVEDLRLVHMRCNSKRGRGAPPVRRGPARKISPVMRDQMPLGTVEADVSPRFYAGSTDPLPPSGFTNSNRANSAAPVVVDQYLDESTYNDPRIATPETGDVAGTYADELIAWLDTELEVQMRPWQAEVARRALEYREDGTLRWSTVVLTVPRQCGKSILAQAVMMWRLCCGEAIWGEPQMCISTAQDLKIARTIWEAASVRLLRRAGDQVRVMRGAGQERIEFGEFGNRWSIVAPTATAANGLSVSMAMIDEAFAVPEDVVRSSIRPTMLARQSPQLWMVSTAGETSSRLLQDYREQAIIQMEDPEKANILIMEWSALPGRDIHDQEGWKEASPIWDGDRAAFIEEEARTSRSPEVFAAQYLNHWTRNLNAWVSTQAWQSCGTSDPIPPREVNPGTIGVEIGKDGRIYGATLAVTDDSGVTWLQAHVEESLEGMRAWLGDFCKERRGVTIIHHKTVKLGDIPGAKMQEKKAEDDFAGFYPAKMAIEEGVMRHPEDEQLTEQVLSAGTWRQGHDGYVKLSAHTSPIEVPLARGMIWAVGRELDPSRRRRVVVAAA